MGNFNFKTVLSYFDIKTLVILGLIIVIGLHFAFGGVFGSSDIRNLKNDNKKLEQQNAQLLKDNAARDLKIASYEKIVNDQISKLVVLDKQSNDKDSVIAILKNKMKYEEGPNIDKLDDNGVVQFFSNHLNTGK